MSIAHQTAMPSAVPRRGPRHRPMVLVPRKRTGWALAKISGLVAMTALGAALAAGAIGLGILMLVASVSGN